MRSTLCVLLLASGLSAVAEEQPEVLEGWKTEEGKWVKTKNGVTLITKIGRLKLDQPAAKQIDLQFDLEIKKWKTEGKYGSVGFVWSDSENYEKEATLNYAVFYKWREGLYIYSMSPEGGHTYELLKTGIPIGKKVHVKARISTEGLVLSMGKIKAQVPIKLGSVNVWLRAFNIDAEFSRVKAKVK